MRDQKDSINWNDSYQNPGKHRQELGCNTSAEVIPAADRALYLELLLRGEAQISAARRSKATRGSRG